MYYAAKTENYTAMKYTIHVLGIPLLALAIKNQEIMY